MCAPGLSGGSGNRHLRSPSRWKMGWGGRSVCDPCRWVAGLGESVSPEESVRPGDATGGRASVVSPARLGGGFYNH